MGRPRIELTREQAETLLEWLPKYMEAAPDCREWIIEQDTDEDTCVRIVLSHENDEFDALSIDTEGNTMQFE